LIHNSFSLLYMHISSERKIKGILLFNSKSDKYDSCN